MYDIVVLLENESQIIPQTGNYSTGIVTKKDMSWQQLFNHVICSGIGKIIYCLADYKLTHSGAFDQIISKYRRFGSFIGCIYSDDDNIYKSYDPNILINTPIAINGAIKVPIFNEKINENIFANAISIIAKQKIVYHIPEKLVRL